MQARRDQIYDELLVIKCQQGEKAAFDELVGRWQKRFWYYAMRLTNSEAAAWDIVQETWYAVIKGIRKLEDPAVFPRWAFRILNNKCSDCLRKRQLQSRLHDKLAEQTENESQKRQTSNDKLDSLYKAIEKLSPDRRALLMLRYNEGFDVGQIAQITETPVGTVKSRIHRALEQLRQAVERDRNE